VRTCASLKRKNLTATPIMQKIEDRGSKIERPEPRSSILDLRSSIV
jgi:hypothetical protein